MNKFAPLLALLLALPLIGAAQGISQLQQFTATTSPARAITQTVFGKPLRLTGQGSGCAQFSANGTLTSTGSDCGTGSGLFGQAWELISGFLTPTTTVPVKINATTTLATTTASMFNGVIVVDGVRYAQTSAGINSAIADCSRLSPACSQVYLPAGTYTVNSRITPKSNVQVRGAGKGGTKLVGSVASDWVIYHNSATQLVNFSISDLSVDLQNGSNASGFQFSNASSTAVERVAFSNGAAGGWFLVYGPVGSVSTAANNYDNKVIDVDFTNHAGSLEALLLSNSQNTQIVRPRLYNISSPGIGLWQADYDTRINDLYCGESSGTSIYYSITTDRTTISNPIIENCGGITGANISDNGAFGLSQAQGLQITNPVFRGGSNTTQSAGIALGAVNNASISGGLIESYQIGILLTNGNHSASSSPTNWTIRGVKIRNNNATNDSFVIHPGILIGTGLGGAQFGLIDGNQIYDDRDTASQKYAIVFDGAATYDGVTISNNRLSAYGGGTSVATADGAALGSNVAIYSNTDYSGSNPSQTRSMWDLLGTSLSYSAGRVGIGTTTPDSGVSILNYSGRALLHIGDTANNSTTKLLIENGWTGAGGYGLVVQRNASTPQLVVDGNGNVGIGTTSPYAKLSVVGSVVAANFVGTTPATSTLGGGIDIVTGCYAVNGACLSAATFGASTFAYPFPSNATTTQIAFSGGLTAFASSTIGAGGTATGLTISGGATTTGTAYFAGRAGFATSTPDSGVSINNFTGRALLHVGDDVTNNSMTKLLIENRWADNSSKSVLVQRNSATPHFMVGGGGFSAFGTSTPYARLTVWGSGSTGSSQNVEFVNSASTTLASILNDGTAYFKGSIGIGTTTPFSIFHVTSGASATTTVTIGSIGLTSSKGCVNMNRSDGGAGSFYINAAGVMVTEPNYCR